MKSKIMFFLLLILGGFSGSKCSRMSCVQQAKQATCIAKCSNSDPWNRDYCKSQCTQQYFGPSSTAGIQLKKVGNVSLDCHNPSGHTTDIRITFDTVKDECYSYRVTCKQISGTYFSNHTTNTTASRGTGIFRRLPLGSKFSVSVQSIVGNIVGNKTTITFETPLPKRTSRYPKTCVLPKVRNLKAKETPMKGNKFNITVYWDKPSSDTKSLTVTLITDRNHNQTQNVPATNSRFTFNDVPILHKYKVSVKASFWAGTGEEASRDCTLGEKKPEKNIKKKPRIENKLSGSTAGIILGVLIGFGCAMAVGWFIYRQRKNQKEREKDSEGGSVADEDGFEEGTSEKEDDLETASLKHT